MSKLRPVNGNVILRPIEEEEQMAGNIIIPDMGKGEYAPTTLQVGMKVLIPKMGAQAITIEGEEYYITAQNSVLSIVE
jgi:co-chaperonin GroES (HSP10)